MSTRNDLTLEQKINLIKQNEGGSSYRELCNNFKISIGAVSNVIKRKREYMRRR
jgi:Mor family transcriptional regulator